MKPIIKYPRANYYSKPYILNKLDIEHEISSETTDIPEDILFNDSNLNYIDVICSLDSHSNFNPATISVNYRNETGTPFENTIFNLYDNSVINLNGIVSSIDIVAEEGPGLLNPVVIYTKSFRTMQTKKINIHETENCSGINTISDAYLFGGGYKPNMALSDIQPYLVYFVHNYNNVAFISIISATEFVNTKNDLLPASDINFDDLSTLQDDIMSGKVKITLQGNNYKSISAVKNTLTNSLFTIKFKKYV